MDTVLFSAWTYPVVSWGSSSSIGTVFAKHKM